MLSFFPTPYPEEWWWSVLCRYFVRSGYHNHATAMKELSPSRSKSVGRLFPAGDIYEVVVQLPAPLFSSERIILQHTLAPYYLRFYPNEKKTQVLAALLSGQSAGLTSIELTTPDGRQGLKWCPVCRQEDTTAYGEPYWHRAHQIPLLSLCPRHGCRLMLHEVPFSRLSELFLPLCAIPDAPPQYNCQPWEAPLSSILYGFLVLPFETGPLPYNNLELTLNAKGFGNKAMRGNNTLDAQKVWTACIHLYGPAVSAQYFPKPSPAVLYRICHWKLTSPERYALLTVFAGLTAEELFGPELPRFHPILEKLRQYQRHGIAYQKDALALAVGVSPSQLDTLAREYGIQPFWKQCGSARTENIRIALSPEEKQRILNAAAIYGNGQTAVFARSILLRAAEKILNAHNQSKEDGHT